MILTISGLHGTGKSTVGKMIAEKLKIKYYSTGEAFRELAKQMKMDLEKLSEYVEAHPKIDKKLDKKIITLAKEGNIIIDSQLSGYLLEDIADFKILLKCPIKIRVQRMAGRDQTNFDEKLKETEFREKSERERFKELYNIDLSDEEKANNLFDLILNTENLSIDETVEKILKVPFFSDTIQ